MTLITTAASGALAADADAGAGKAKAESVCAARHGANGISVSDTILTRPGQRRRTSKAS